MQEAKHWGWGAWLQVHISNCLYNFPRGLAPLWAAAALFGFLQEDTAFPLFTVGLCEHT